MITCKKIEDQIFDFVEESLPQETYNMIKKHISACNDCAELFDKTKALKFHLKNLSLVKTSPEFDTILRTRIKVERSIRRESIVPRSFRVPVYVATGALAVLAVVFVLNTSGNNLNEKSARMPVNNFTSRPLQSGSQADRSQVMFPMDRVRVKGTPLNSQSFGGRSSAPADSNRSESQNRIQTVEF